jgi:DNA-binding transcriptional LysR family regulator
MQPAIDLRQMRYLVVVVEEGQITRAAQRLHLAQPALSQAIAKLETQLGVQLLERRPRGIEPTPAGAAFYEKARLALTAVEEAAEVLRPWARSETRLCLAFLPTLGQLARPWLRRLIAEFPDIDLQTRHLDADEMLVELKRGRVDAELIFPPPRDPELTHLVVLRSPRYVLMHENHPLAGEQSLEYEQIANETRPGRHPSVPARWAEEAWLMGYRGTEPKFTKEKPTSTDEVWALVSSGKAISILPEFMVLTAQGYGVRAVPLSDVEPVEVALTRRRDDKRAIVAALFEAAASGANGTPVASEPHRPGHARAPAGVRDRSSSPAQGAAAAPAGPGGTNGSRS